MTPEQYGCLVRDHLIPSHTPASTPAGRRGKKRKEDDGESAPVGVVSGGSDASSSESDSSDEEDREQRKRRSALKQPGTGPKRSRHAESADDTDVEDKAEYGKKKSVRHDLRTELKVITPTGVALLLAAAILFKEAGVREAASFAMPTDWDDEEREAYEGRAGRAVSRLRAVIEDKWPVSTYTARLS